MTETYWQNFVVPYSYPVVFDRDVFNEENKAFLDLLRIKEKGKRHRVLFVLDGGLVSATPTLTPEIKRYVSVHAEHIDLVAEPIILPGGEEVKASDQYYWELVNAIQRNHIDRHSYFIAVGGGSLLDLAGLVAATAHRGVRHIRVPTTVLSQNDSGVGVKNSINYAGQKNFVGTFMPPWAVLCDSIFLNTLSKRDKVSGIAEAVKVALIKDGDFFKEMEASADDLAEFKCESVERMIRRCAELHMHQIASGGDPFEAGSARPLDFGHWSAHKLESLSRYEMRHGEAVAIGIALDARYSVLNGMLPEGEDDRIAKFLEKIGFELWSPHMEVKAQGADTPAFVSGIQEFREHLGGQLTITLLNGIGKGIEVHEMDIQKILGSIVWLKNRHIRRKGENA